jgi:hypothetical protein
MTIYEPKERIIQIAPYYPFRIIHKAMVLVLRKFYYSQFIDQSYACIKGRGIHKCMNDVRDALSNDNTNTRYCLKLDIRKYYNNINHEVLKQLHRQKISDEKMLQLIYFDIDSSGQEVGLPIGNETSQYYANLYLTPLDRYCKEQLNLKHYFRYMDDIVILSGSKDHLHDVLSSVRTFVNDKLKLEIKSNYQIFPVSSRQIDFVGYRMNHHTVMLRKRILMRFYKRTHAKRKALKKQGKLLELKHDLPSYYGWIKHLPTEHSLKIFQHATTV